MKLSNNKDLLRQIIISHYDEPNNKIEDDDLNNYQDYQQFHNKSATCIDDIKMIIKWDDDRVVDAKFCGIGCAISTASTDIFCDIIKDKTKEQVTNILNEYEKMINNQSFDEDILEELIAFVDIHKQANRIKCSLMGSNTLKELLNEKK